jgi:hypothetical protein
LFTGYLENVWIIVFDEMELFWNLPKMVVAFGVCFDACS